MKVSFLDVKSQNEEIKKQAMSGLKQVMDSGDFILGQQVRDFEREFSAFCGSKFALGVNSGTDALFLSLLSIGVGPGDEVICPVYTYIATALSISYTGAKPVFADIDPLTYNIDPDKIQEKITKKTKAIIAVHLYGNPAAMEKIVKIAKANKIKVIEDAAQAHGSAIKLKNGKWKKSGSIGDIGCFSFYPTKNLGGCGDGGMIVTDNKKIYDFLHMLRDQGRRGKNRYLHFVRGYNSRLDSLQAVLLREKLKKLKQWNDSRIKAAQWYAQLLQGIKGITLPYTSADSRHVYHIYPVLIKRRDKIQSLLAQQGIGSAVVYHRALHLQKAYADLKHKKGDFPAAEKISKDILCLPMHSHLSRTQVEYIAENLKKAVC